jgi:purine-binding chemotaxis protein CheW
MTSKIAAEKEFVTFEIGGQLFGLPIDEVQDVFKPLRLTPVPLAHRDIAGVMNLRGRIVTMIDGRKHLGMPRRAAGDSVMAVGVERGGESYGLLVDSVGEVLSLDPASVVANPVNLDACWRAVSKGVFRLQNRLLIILDINKILDFGRAIAA